MGHAVDFVLNVMKAISSDEPVLFQRDGSLYVASEQGFGQVTYGLRTKPEEFQSWEKREQAPEINESENLILGWKGEKYNQKPVFKTGNSPYLIPICFGEDACSFSLEEMAKGAKELSGRKDDGKIRMILHGSTYHSHKYGYAADGIDVYLREGRVMDQDRYLELIRHKEDELIDQIRALGNTEDWKRDGFYDRSTFPDCVIITPYIAVSLPRGGQLWNNIWHDTGADSWSKGTRLKSEWSGSTKGSIMQHGVGNSYNKSPYSVNVKINAQALKATDAKGFGIEKQKAIDNLEQELSAVDSNMALAEEFVAKLNAVHDELFAANIKSSKEMRKNRPAERT